MLRRPPRSTLFPTRRSSDLDGCHDRGAAQALGGQELLVARADAPDLEPDEWWAEELEGRSEEHMSELQSHSDLVCRLLLEKKKKKNKHADRRKRYRRSDEDS